MPAARSKVCSQPQDSREKCADIAGSFDTGSSIRAAGSRRIHGDGLCTGMRKGAGSCRACGFKHRCPLGYESGVLGCAGWEHTISCSARLRVRRRRGDAAVSEASRDVEGTGWVPRWPVSSALLARGQQFWRLAVSLQWAEAMCAPPRFREEDGAFAAVCSWELTVPGKLPNLRLMDEPLSEPENLSDKQSGAL